MWAYPWMIAFLLTFIQGYEGYQLIVAFTWGMVLLTAFDIVITALTWYEYRTHRASHRPGNTSAAVRNPEYQTEASNDPWLLGAPPSQRAKMLP